MFLVTCVIFLLSGSLFEYLFYSIERVIISLYAKSKQKSIRYVTALTSSVQFLKLPILLLLVFVAGTQLLDTYSYVQFFIFFCMLNLGKYVITDYLDALNV